MNNSFFALISRMKFIGRWGLMRNSVAENIQEHSHMVAVLAHALAVIRRDVYGRDCDPNLCATVALFHDATEIYTGDMPTPIKYHNPAIRDAYKMVEGVAEAKLLATISPEIRSAYDSLISPTDSSVLELVKAADRLSAYIKCVEELEAGNGDFRLAKQQIYDSIIEQNLPESMYFLQNYGDKFGLTLDELTS